MKSWKAWLIAVIVLIGLGVGVGPYIYFHLIAGKAPPPLTIGSSSPAATGTTSSGSVDGTWTIASGSVVGYRVEEVIFGRSNTAAGRTSDVTGSAVIDGTTVSSATFTVDMATVTSDEDRRDGQFRGRIMDVTSYPTATFKLTRPIELTSLPAEGVEATATAAGDLTLHGTTKTVTVTLHGVHSNGVIEVSGSIPITFAEWNIPNPSNMFAQTRDDGTLEFLLKLSKA